MSMTSALAARGRGGKRWIAAASAQALSPRCRPSSTSSTIISSRSSSSSLLTIHQASHLLSSDLVSAESLAGHCRRLAAHGDDDGEDPNSLKLNAFAHLRPLERVLKDARRSDERRRGGRSLSPLDGIPVTIKANIAVRDLPLTAGSDILVSKSMENSDLEVDAALVGCGYDADVTHRLLRDCGAVLIGVTNMDEFGMGSLGTNIHGEGRGSGRSGRDDGAVINPLSFLSNGRMMHPTEVGDEASLERYTDFRVALYRRSSSLSSTLLSAGGSSSGSAASIALGSSLLSIGTDTGGSVRLPASWCGVTGFKPTYGSISRYGVVSYASSLDTVGLLAPTPECVALAYRCLANYEGNGRCRDSTAIYLGGSRPGPSSSSLCDDEASMTAPAEDASDGIAGDDNRHSIGAPSSSSTPSSPTPSSLEGMRIGIPSAFSVAECPPLMSRAWRLSADILSSSAVGATLVSIPPDVVRSDTVARSLSAYYVLACAEASSNLARYDGTRYGMSYRDLVSTEGGVGEVDGAVGATGGADGRTELERRYSAVRAAGFGPEVQRRIIAGTAVLSSDRFHTHYEAAARLRAALRREFDAGFFGVGEDVPVGGANGERRDHVPTCDVMLVPTALFQPCELELKETVGRGNGGCSGSADGGTEMLANDVMTVPASLAGLPAISVPIEVEVGSGGDKEGEGAAAGPGMAAKTMRGKKVVVGMQLFGPPGMDDSVLRVASALHRAFGK